MSRGTVLVIDDDPWMSEHYSRVLTKNDYTVLSAADALEGLEMIDASRPDVLILDMFMPGPNGVVLLHELQSHEDLSKLPVIVSTNSAANIKKSDIENYGVREVLDKATMEPDDLVAAVRKVL